MQSFHFILCFKVENFHGMVDPVLDYDLITLLSLL